MDFCATRPPVAPFSLVHWIWLYRSCAALPRGSGGNIVEQHLLGQLVKTTEAVHSAFGSLRLSDPILSSQMEMNYYPSGAKPYGFYLELLEIDCSFLGWSPSIGWRAMRKTSMDEWLKMMFGTGVSSLKILWMCGWVFLEGLIWRLELWFFFVLFKCFFLFCLAY